MEMIQQPRTTGIASKWTYRKQSVANLVRMGHCAPTVMQTLLDVSHSEKEWLVKMSAGMPGGIGNAGFECGAVISPLVFMGLRYGPRELDRGLPVIFERGHALCKQFLQCHRTMHCKEIRGNDRFPRHCIRPVCLAPELYAAAASSSQSVIPAKTRESYVRMFSHLCEKGFHCAHAVLDPLNLTAPKRQELLDAVSAFVGGTLFMGMTCGAFTAGVMAVGLSTGEIENSPLRVIRMLARMTFGGNAFDEKINKFNRPMNAGYRLSRWFKQEFGSTQCRAITGCDFSDEAGVSKYIETDCVTRCRQIAAKVAGKVQKSLASLEAIRGAASGAREKHDETS